MNASAPRHTNVFRAKRPEFEARLASSQNEAPVPRAKKWQDWADEYLSGPLGDFLDFGCGDGEFLARVRSRCSHVVGVDMDAERLALAQRRLADGEFVKLAPRGRLPFPDATFHNACILEVIEHVPRERPVLRELARILRPGGRLLLTTPHRGLLTFLDAGNVKFLVPNLHRFIHCHIMNNREGYERQFGRGRQAEGMIGDFATQDGAWHRHYALDEIRRLAPRELRIERWGIYFPYFRAVNLAWLILRTVTRGRRNALPAVVMRKVAQFSHRRGWAGDQLVVLFRKQ